MKGEFLAVSGPDALDAGLYRVQMCPRKVIRVGTAGRYSAVGAGGGSIVATNALEGVDRLVMLRAGELLPVPGLGSPHAFSPSVSPDGGLAFVQLQQDGTFALRVRRPGERRAATLYSSKSPLSPLDWVGSDAVAVIEASADARAVPTGEVAVVVVGLSAQPRRHPVPLRAVEGFAWGAKRGLALSAPTESGTPGILLDPRTGRISGSIPRGWAVRDWSADGELLVVNRGSAVGVIRAARVNKVVELGDLPSGPVWNGAWAN